MSDIKRELDRLTNDELIARARQFAARMRALNLGKDDDVLRQLQSKDWNVETAQVEGMESLTDYIERTRRLEPEHLALRAALEERIGAPGGLNPLILASSADHLELIATALENSFTR